MMEVPNAFVLIGLLLITLSMCVYVSRMEMRSVMNESCMVVCVASLCMKGSLVSLLFCYVCWIYVFRETRAGVSCQTGAFSRGSKI